jgi:endogenous inhibitor of DNA gyrase (YacG/DUF329 family)
MGMYDSVYVQCPQCGTDLDFQSKAGECRGAIYTLQSAPIAVLSDVLGITEKCPKCGTFVTINGTLSTWLETWKKPVS